MSIASEITRINTNIANAYTACSNKGATLPATQNSANLASCIGTITTGGGTQYIKRDVTNGKMTMPSGTYTLPSDVTEIGKNALQYSFQDSSITGADLSSLITVSGIDAMKYCFTNCTSLTSVDLSSLTTISQSNGMYNGFNSCRALTSISLSSLTTVSGSSAMSYCFYSCNSLTSVSLSSLTTLSGSSAMSYCFGMSSGETNSLTTVTFSVLNTLTGSNALQNCFQYRTALTSVSFPALNSTSFGSRTNQFNKMLQGITGCTVHFPRNLQSVIGNWTDVTAGFGGTNTTVLFDLTATE